MTESILVLGTHNQKKKRELVQLLEPHGFNLLNLADFDSPLSVEETGATFAENARLKAAKQAQHLQHWVLGEDSGLSVDALGGAPGVLSARFSASGGDESNNDLLLDRLNEVPANQRTAYYSCHVAIADPDGNIRIETHGRCRGLIRFERSGDGGFGYDPLFEIVEYHLTFAQLGDTVKSVLSHRARAMRKTIPALIRLFATIPLQASR